MYEYLGLLLKIYLYIKNDHCKRIRSSYYASILLKYLITFNNCWPSI